MDMSVFCLMQEVIVVSTEMLLVGISDDEMVSRVGDLAISLLQLGKTE